ncbi:anthranilate phosphoribosyltransferase [Allorhodopirellula heiligendammensis]|uniref:Anthranilate phosphoribosyltransferase n=1 Tax=Allorhodopirellula heiligendammensis TaxID=2714739 RepID=A0A5C6BSE5_9BACT|nr:anthranilate phosphoribosyltransferase [Allorhodopirellula heiligendammensis]TWU15163.1 Anthranilate phosphoribosyltransferase [Allorhodopirellula heiligendammensis]
MLDFPTATALALAGTDLTSEQTGHLIDTMLRGEAAEENIGELLLALREKGESVSELVGAATAMRGHMTRIEHGHDILLDTCGTGGSGSGTFNISTAVAILAAACGVAVAKHGNRAATSRSGSADVLEHLGVPIESDAAEVARSLNDIGICFCFAAKLHPAMRHVVAIRRRLGVPTLFNLLGPLCNPAAATHQLLGTVSPIAQAKIAAALSQLDTQRSFVVRAEDGQDEISLDGITQCIEVCSSEQTKHHWTATDFGLPAAKAEALVVADPAESAQVIRDIFAGQPGPPRDTVIAGCAAALLLVGKSDNLQQAARIAADAIDSGAAQEKMRQLCRR